MTKEEIVKVYKKYRKSQASLIKIETGLLDVPDQEKWMLNLSNKSSFLRKTYCANEEMLTKVVLPYFNGTQELTLDTANEFLEKIIEMQMNAENDFLLVTSVLNILTDFFHKEKQLDKEILSLFFTALSYADRVYEGYQSIILELFGKITTYAVYYCEIDNWDARRRIIFAYYNRLANIEVNTNISIPFILEIYHEVVVFCKREDVRELDGDKIDFDEYVDSCRRCALFALTRFDRDYTEEEVNLVKNEFIKADITDESLNSEQSDNALAYIWYMYNNGKRDVNQTILLLYHYYCEKDKEIDYSSLEFYGEEAYQIQMSFMEDCLHFLAMDECKLDIKEEIVNSLTADFKRYYESVPYLENNSLLNSDLADILTQLLKNTEQEEECIQYIMEVLLRRNTMTLIHSTMVAKISEFILDGIIRNNPDLLIPLKEDDLGEKIYTSEAELMSYVRNAAYLHDIGKNSISDIINLQTRKLLNEEFVLVKKHPELGCRILNGTSLIKKYGDIILGHHKFYNGKGGYPEDFNNTASSVRIIIDLITIADCIDAATDMLGRNYATGKRFLPEVLEELIKESGTRYNPDIVKVILSDDELKNQIQDITVAGRVGIYYDIYKAYLHK